MKVLITGATGLIGQDIISKLVRSGVDIAILTRNKEKAKKKLLYPIEIFEWDPINEVVPTKALVGVDAIINLMGENISSGRWTKQMKHRIYQSRVIGTRNLIKGLLISNHQVKTFIQGSAIGVYAGNLKQEDKIDESGKLGSGFLAETCISWENELQQLPNNIRQVTIRTGVVLAKNGGALNKMLPAFKAGVAGKLGDGSQWMSWIHIEDLVALFLNALNNTDYAGVYNGTAPNPVTNAQFTKTLANIIKMPALIPAPKFMLKLLLGEMSSILLDSGHFIPKKAMKQGYIFKYPDTTSALDNLLNKKKLPSEKKVALYQNYKKEQWIETNLEKTFDFFSNASNLQKITPPWLSFTIKQQSDQKVEQGSTYEYSLKIKGIPIKWKSYIDEFKENDQFVDYQTKGPYKTWHHTHKFIPYKNGTLIVDDIYYKVPFGKIGDLLLGPFIKKDIDKIFEYRSNTISGILK